MEVLTAIEPEGTGCEAKGRKTFELPVVCVVDVGLGVGVGEEAGVIVVDGLGIWNVDEDVLVVVDGDGDGVVVVGVLLGVAALFWASSCRRIG